MLTPSNSHQPAPEHDRGSTLITVVVAMLVLSVFAIALAGMVTSTARGLVLTRSTVESRAAADAGLTALLAHVRRTGDFCALSNDDITNRPADGADYRVSTTDCVGGTVTFESIGSGTGSAETTVRAEYYYIEDESPGGGAEMVFFGENTQFTAQVRPVVTEGLATILLPSGSFQCGTSIPANILVKSDFTSYSGCSVGGAVIAGANVTLGNTAVAGNVLAGGSSSWPQGVNLSGSATVGGTITLPSGRELRLADMLVPNTLTSHARVFGGRPAGISRPATVSLPEFQPWFEFPYDSATDWSGYGPPIEINNTTSPWNCSNIDTSATGSNFWTTYLSGLTSNTVIDARACSGGLTSNNTPVAQTKLGVNVVFLAKSITLSRRNFQPKAGTTPQVWFVVPDPNPSDHKPTCSGGAGNINTNGGVTMNVLAMAYTPCQIQINNGGSWLGSYYGGTFQAGSDLVFNASPIGLPGQWAGGGAGGAASRSLGELKTRRELR